MIQATGIETQSGVATSYLATMKIDGETWHRQLTPCAASALAERLLLEACNLLRSNPRGDHHNSRAYIHDLAALAESWEREDAEEEARADDAAAQRAIDRAADLADAHDAAYLEAGSPHPHDR